MFVLQMVKTELSRKSLDVYWCMCARTCGKRLCYCLIAHSVMFGVDHVGP
jgi:hypothetical protein